MISSENEVTKRSEKQILSQEESSENTCLDREEKKNCENETLVVEFHPDRLQMIQDQTEQDQSIPKSKNPLLSFRNRRNQRKEKNKRSETADKLNGDIVTVKTKDIESFARKFMSAIFKSFSESHDRKIEENRPFANRRPPRIQLYGTSNADEHFERVECALKIAKGKYGQDGLIALGFQYKLRACSQHKKTQDSKEADEHEKMLTSDMDSNVAQRLSFPLYGQDQLDNNQELNASHSEQVTPIISVADNNKIKYVEEVADICPECYLRLYHIDSGTLITINNRSTFIADEDMYEEVVRLCQEYAQDLIQEEADLHWITVCEDKAKGRPIRALVHEDYKEQLSLKELVVFDDLNRNSGKPCTILPNTLLITTGRGKVRAGIFSRQHLLVSGIETSTCLASVREAHKRGMRVVILDPNARGERCGMDTYEQSLQVIFGGDIYQESVPESPSIQQRDQNSSLYIFAHSASGSQLTRHLINDGSYLMQHLRAIVFTDSSHTIQWLKKYPEVSSFLQSSSSLYVRSANENRDNNWEKRVPGERCETEKDHCWKHRFGDIPTIWAGTKDHSLGNWTAHSYIWEHFDKHLGCHENNKEMARNQ